MSSIWSFVSPRLLLLQCPYAVSMSIGSVDVLETRCRLLFSCFLLDPFFSFLSYLNICLDKKKNNLFQLHNRKEIRALLHNQKQQPLYLCNTKNHSLTYPIEEKIIPLVTQYKREKYPLCLHKRNCTEQKNQNFSDTK